MMKKAVLILLLLISGCSNNQTQSDTGQEPELLFYIGITMVKPVSELVNEFEKTCNCNVRIIQGGSKDLYESLKASRQGDLYLPGSTSYRNSNLKDGLLLDARFVGYNKASIMVAKGNPKGFTPDLNIFSDKENKVVLCNPESGSIGKETKNILTAFGNYEEAIVNSTFLTTDSRNLTKAIVDGSADVVINWHATNFWKENKGKVDYLPIDNKYAKKKMLAFNLLKDSKHPELAKKFMDLAASDFGRKVFFSYGFLDNDDLTHFSEITVK